ncbi:MAG: hypothetical protein LBE13_13780 [Bacteroidales bacterium]|jgi:hypothetical protein|nr:hypothetical protein [Bacteroidales bacterium]
MAGESENISKMAEILTNEMFNEFFWEKSGPININWKCINENHEKKTHPSDIVFSYLEPYVNSRTYLNCDLKSYSKKSINKISIKTAVENLSMAVSCAENSEDWQEKYIISNNDNFNVHGLLFIYNHDGEYDNDFQTILEEATQTNIQLPLNRRIYILNPKDICYLYTVVNDLKRLRGDGYLPQSRDYQYYYPDLTYKKVVSAQVRFAATIEMLLGPFFVLRYKILNRDNTFGLLVYYKKEGKSVDEFIYIIDYLFHYQQLQNYEKIDICLANPYKDAPAIFSAAKKEYSVKLNESGMMGERLNIIHYRSVNNIFKYFSEVEIGMRYE